MIIRYKKEVTGRWETAAVNRIVKGVYKLKNPEVQKIIIVKRGPESFLIWACRSGRFKMEKGCPTITTADRLTGYPMTYPMTYHIVGIWRWLDSRYQYRTSEAIVLDAPSNIIDAYFAERNTDTGIRGQWVITDRNIPGFSYNLDLDSWEVTE